MYNMLIWYINNGKSAIVLVKSKTALKLIFISDENDLLIHFKWISKF